MHELIVRPAAAPDYEWIRALPEFPHEDVTEARALTAGVHLLAERGGELIGALTASDNGDWLELVHVHVAFSARRTGAGRALVLALQAAAIERARPRILLEVRQDNLSAIALYSSLGFTQFHVRKHYYSDGMNALEFEWLPTDRGK